MGWNPFTPKQMVWSKTVSAHAEVFSPNKNHQNWSSEKLFHMNNYTLRKPWQVYLSVVKFTGNIWNTIYFSVRDAGIKPHVPMSTLKLQNFISGITRSALLPSKPEPRHMSKISDLTFKGATLKETVWQESWISLSLLGKVPNEVQKKRVTPV